MHSLCIRYSVRGTHLAIIVAILTVVAVLDATYRVARADDGRGRRFISATTAPLRQDSATGQNSQASKETTQQAAVAESASDPEQIAALERTIESESQRLTELEAELTRPDSEYAQAEAAFRAIDREINDTREQIEQFKQQGKTREASILERSVKAAETQWTLAKDRFGLAIEERKTLREEITTLKQKIQKDREELEELTGANEPDDSHDKAASNQHTVETPGANASKDSAPAGAVAAAAAADQTSDEDASEPPDEELVQAEAAAKEKQREAEEAKEEAQQIAARMADLQKIILQEQKVLELARKKADLALTTQQALEAELAKKQADGADPAEIESTRQAIAAAKDRFVQARQNVVAATDRLTDSQSELSSLQQQQIIAMQAEKKARLEADAAKGAVDELRNPFAPRNILRWATEHGPRVVCYLIAMIAALQCAKVFSHRIIRFMTGGSGRGSSAERENRAQTLVGVFQNAASVSIIIGGSLSILDELGAKVGVLLGGVAVMGLAVAFGAQNLIKDYFYGFVMLLENQYMLNDVVRIGDLTGQVERITLRMTVLRDANGVVHFIPNGQINSVSNETHGWSRAAFEIGVAYKENVDRCIVVLAELAAQLRRDPTYGAMIIDDATPPAVDQLADSSVVLKFFIKTRPNQQSAVRREMLRRIKNRFDELGIEMPFPQRTIYHRYEDATPARPEQPQSRRVA